MYCSWSLHALVYISVYLDAYPFVWGYQKTFIWERSYGYVSTYEIFKYHDFCFSFYYAFSLKLYKHCFFIFKSIMVLGNSLGNSKVSCFSSNIWHTFFLMDNLMAVANSEISTSLYQDIRVLRLPWHTNILDLRASVQEPKCQSVI